LRAVSPVALAGLLIAARSLLVGLDLPCPTVDAIVTATEASRSRAYEISSEIVALLPSLVAARGRPSKPIAAPSRETAELTEATLTYVMRHPGCVHRDDHRQQYSDAFRCFILDLYRSHSTSSGVDIEAFAVAVQVPIGTLKDWLRAPRTTTPSTEQQLPAPAPETDAKSLHVQTVIDAWEGWKGTFVGFCEHVRRDLHVPFRRSLVGSILRAHGLRRAAKRAGRSPDESALRGAFKTHFPGAQWVGDGMHVPVVVDGQPFHFNVELNVDAHTGAFVGVSVRDEEDAAAVVEALHDGVATTGAPPLALLLDNRPSNHTPEVDAALGDTLRMRATPLRPQNKAHVEGAFGLFSQVLPHLVLDTKQSPHDLALRFLVIITTLWARTTNHRPRKDHDGRSRVDLYADEPTAEQIERARRDLRELTERQERARRTLEARRRPEVLALLDEHFARLGLLDPERHIRVAIAGHPLEAIVAGIALFDGKRLANTLPDGVDARYLLGIVYNVAATMEGEHVTRCLFRLRVEMRDRMLASLVTEREAILATRDTDRACADCVDAALATPSPVARTFWLHALAALIGDRGAALHEARFCAAGRRIHATFAVTLRERHDAVRLVAERLVLIA
jgi:transposase InsO family protein